MTQIKHFVFRLKVEHLSLWRKVLEMVKLYKSKTPKQCL